MNQLTHTDKNGIARMVDVGHKPTTVRTARATGKILMQTETLQKIKNNDFKKGDVLSVAKIAGIMAAKKTSDLIPMCHQLNLSKVSIEFEFIDKGIQITSMTKLNAQTGVEMEALTAISVALLTIYDMCKAVDRFMKITEIQLLEKSGGQSGNWITPR